MANRYLRASGNWNGAVWAATSGGAAGSASTPTAGDRVHLSANFTVTLTADAACERIEHRQGTLNLSSYKLSVGGQFAGWNEYRSYPGTAHTLNMGSGVLEITGGGYNSYSGGNFAASSSLTIVPGTSQLVMNVNDFNEDFDTGSAPAYLGTLGKTFNDVIINLGYNASQSFGFNITGSPTFRSLIIQSKNSAAHTVNVEETVKADKYVLIGSSVANRLTLNGNGTGMFVVDDPNADGNTTATSYGQYVDTGDVPIYTSALYDFNQAYIGNNSIGNSSWIYQDTPKISTLVDPLTTAPASNPNWTVSGIVTQVTSGKEGGGYQLTNGAKMTSTDTYDLVDSSIIFERPARDGTSDYAGFGVMALGDIFPWSSSKVAVTSEIYDNEEYANIYQYRQGSYDYQVSTYPTTTSKYIKAAISGQTLTVNHSDDGVTWSNGIYSTLSDEDLLMFRSVRLLASNRGVNLGQSQSIGSINTLPEPPAPTSQGNFLTFFGGL